MTFDPARLRLARQRRHWTATALANKSGVSRVTISNAENGNNAPDPKTVFALADALDFPVEFFYGDTPEPLEAEAVSFRSLKSMTARQRDASLAGGQIGLMIAAWVDREFNFPPPAIPRVDDADPEVAAREVRSAWGLGERPITNLMKLLESKGVMFFSLAEKNRRVDAFSCWRGSRPFVFLNQQKTAEHGRMDIAHELGHLVMHVHGASSGQEAETEANAFGAAFLMPRHDVMSRIPVVRSVTDILSAKARWRVSAMALTHRLHRLDILSEWRYRGMCIELGRLGYRTAEPDGVQREASTLWHTVLRLLWQRGVTKEAIAADLNLPRHEVEVLLDGLLGEMPNQTGPTPGQLRSV